MASKSKLDTKIGRYSLNKCISSYNYLEIISESQKKLQKTGEI